MHRCSICNGIWLQIFPGVSPWNTWSTRSLWGLNLSKCMCFFKSTTCNCWRNIPLFFAVQVLRRCEGSSCTKAGKSTICCQKTGSSGNNTMDNKDITSVCSVISTVICCIHHPTRIPSQSIPIHPLTTPRCYIRRWVIMIIALLREFPELLSVASI